MSFNTIKSSRVKYEFKDWDKLISDIKEYSYAIIYNFDSVKIFRSEDIQSIDKENFLELRAFKENEELHIVKVGEEYFGRKRTDGDGEEAVEVEFVDEDHLLWGKYQKEEDGYVHLSEDRGTELKLPLEFTKKGKDKEMDKERAFVTIRNYLNLCTDIFEFNDYRMVKFFVKEVEEYGIYPN